MQLYLSSTDNRPIRMFPFAEEGEGIRYQYLGGEYPTQVQIVLENVAEVCFAVLTFWTKIFQTQTAEKC